MVDVVVSGVLSGATNVDSIFEKHTIKDIHEINKKIQNEIDKKKEDVRQMVGERYRDLIEAADTISEMKITIEQITKNISSMEKQCSSLQEHQIQQTQETSVKQLKRKKMLDRYYAVAVQIKLLMDLPGKFWAFVENGKYLLAAELFLLAKQIHSNLQTYAGLGIPVSLWFPIVPRQLAITSHFRRTVLQACENKLNKQDVAAEELVQCLCCLLVLDQQNSFQQVFDKFLEARFKLIQDMFKPNQQDISIKDQVCQTICIIIKTFQLLYEVFVESTASDRRSLLEQVCENIKTTESPIYLITYLGSPAAKYIPQSIVDFKIHLPEYSDLPFDKFQSSCSTWVQSVVDFINKNMLNTLHFITNVRGLAVICDAVWEIIADNEKDNLWQRICLKLIGCSFQIWEEIFQVLFLKQAQIILQAHVDQTFDALFQQMTEFLQKDDVQRKYEKNISSYVWCEGDGDLPSNIGWITSANRTPLDGGKLFMKSRGFTPYIQCLCQTLNLQLASLLDDLGTFQQKHNVESENGEKIQMYLMKATTNNIKSLIDKCNQYVAGIHLDDKEQSLLGAAENNYLSCILMLARLYRALTELCPALSQCLSIPSSTPTKGSYKHVRKLSDTKGVSEGSDWIMIKSQLQDEANRMMNFWKEQIMQNFRQKVISGVKFWTPEEALLCLPQWDSIKIQEETESGQQMTSVIQVPLHVSSELFSCLIDLCKTINLVGSHTLTRQLLEDLQLEMIESVAEAYEALPENVTVSQVIALQLLFDFHFFVNISGVKDDKMKAGRIQNIIDSLESHIDPFDLDVFTPYIHTNLRRCIHRSIVLFGPVISSTRLGLMAASSRSTMSSNQEQNKTLIINTSSPRFSALPIGGDIDASSSNYSNSKKKSAEKLDKGSRTSHSTGSTLPEATKSTASSLFEAMSSSWFRN